MGLWKFFPRNEEFFSDFEASADNILEGARLLEALLEDFTDVEEKARQILAVENEGDRITHEIIKKLNRTFVTPIDREDIYDLTTSLDDVLDYIEAASDRLTVFKIKTPTEEAKALGLIIRRSAEEIVKGIRALHRMPEIFPHAVELNRLENEADRITRDAVAHLFEIECDPITVIKWKEIYETLEEATDRCEDVANVLEAIALKHT
jgi:predicted phosphate transport protein (TIGR00153 family)